MGRHHQNDFYGWTQGQADALRRCSVNEIDWDHLRDAEGPITFDELMSAPLQGGEGS